MAKIVLCQDPSLGCTILRFHIVKVREWFDQLVGPLSSPFQYIPNTRTFWKLFVWQEVHHALGFWSSKQTPINKRFRPCASWRFRVAGPSWIRILISFSGCADFSINSRVLPVLHRQISLQRVLQVRRAVTLPYRIFISLTNTWDNSLSSCFFHAPLPATSISITRVCRREGWLYVQTQKHELCYLALRGLPCLWQLTFRCGDSRLLNIWNCNSVCSLLLGPMDLHFRLRCQGLATYTRTSRELT